MRLTDYLLSTPDIQWRYAAQLGIRYAVGRMPDGRMEETADSFELLKAMKERYEAEGFELKVLEPAPPNQKIKMNLPGRDEEIERMIRLIRHMGQLGIEVLCYNFPAHFNWGRTRRDLPERGGALGTGYYHDDLDQSVVTGDGTITREALWENLAYLQKAIVPVAEEAGVRLALHPDDPPQPAIQHIGRILTSADAMERAINLCPSPNAGIAMCQATFRMMGEDVVACIHRFGRAGRIHLVHFRDVRGDKNAFHETFHDNGMTDMAACVEAYEEECPDCFVRVDHVPTMAGEENDRPGYESLGRLFAIGYLKGLMEMQAHCRKGEAHGNVL
jgi:mannonate dehydratase